jgi:N-formylglutamate deformylase
VTEPLEVTADREVFVYRAAIAEELPVLVSIPHTGTLMTPEVSRDLASDAMREGAMADWHLDALYAFLPEFGIDVIHAVYHRFVIDLNRPPVAMPLYPGRFETSLVPLETFHGEPVYLRPPAAEEIARRLALYHAPYHAAITRRLEEKVAKFGHCYLVDAHSVESRPSRLHGALVQDVFLGDRDGTTCDPWFTDLIQNAFVRRGLKVSRNAPYKGGYITAHYGGGDFVQSLQIEMCQRLYMTEGEPGTALASTKFAQMQRLLRDVFGDLADAVLAGQCVRRL